jgi:hypothetical protein
MHIKLLDFPFVSNQKAPNEAAFASLSTKVFLFVSLSNIFFNRIFFHFGKFGENLTIPFLEPISPAIPTPILFILE